MPLIQTTISEFPEYHKIDTIFERDKETFVVNPSILKQPVLATIREWDVTEKIDGTNVRVMLSAEGEVSFGGRTNAAMLPADLIQYLMRTFTPERMKAALWIDGKPTRVTLYGEGYGPGIAKGGGLYRKDKAFILFDVLVSDTPEAGGAGMADGRGSGDWWLERESIEDIARKLGIDSVPYLGRMNLPEIIDLVRTPFASKIGTAIAEGIVARPIQTLFDRRGERLIIKLKTKDFRTGKR